METARDMQVTLLDRLILILVALFLVVLALSLAVSSFGWQGTGSISVLLERFGAGVLEAGITALILLSAGLYLLFFAIRHEKEEGIRQETEMGHVRISLRAVENLVYRTARNVKGIKDVDVVVHPSPEGVAVSLSLVINPEFPIPRISEEVGQRVRTHVRDTVGVDVGDVAIEIRNIAGDTRTTRVE